MKESFQTKLKYILISPKTIVLMFFLIISVLFFNYDFSNEKRIVISSVSIGSHAEKSGIEVSPNSKLRDLEKIIEIDGVQISNERQFFEVLEKIEKNNFNILTDKNIYTINNFLDNSTNLSNSQILGLSFRDAPKSNLKLGIELEGGTKMFLKPTNQNLTETEFKELIEILSQRLNKGGLSGTKIEEIFDIFSDERFILVESTSSNKNQIVELLKRQGNFVAKLGDKVVFTNDNIDRTRISENNFEGCSQNYICSYSFSILIDENGTNSFFNVAKNLNTINGRLEDNIYLYLDGILITNLTVASDFKYKKINTPQISVSGVYNENYDRALSNAQKEADNIKLLLKTGPLPTEIQIVSSYTISNSLSEKFLENSMLIGLVSLLLVSTIISFRYRNPLIFIGVFVCLISEVIIIFGLSSLLSWGIVIDLVAIGGLIAAIGTGVDDQIIITDEYFRKENKNKLSKSKVKRAIVIILIAYLTTLAAMLPLSFAGLEIIKGFSIMIILGITIGVLITRPFYANYLRLITTTKKQRDEEDEELENQK